MMTLGRPRSGPIGPILLALPLIVAAALPAADAMAEESVDLHFAWPDNLSGRTTLILRSANQQNAGPETVWEGRASARFSVAPAAGGLVVAFDDHAFEVTMNTADGPAAQLAEVLAPVFLTRPDYRIGADGAFLGLHRPQDVLKSVATATNAAAADLPPDLLEPLEPVIERFLAEEIIAYHAENRWLAKVGRWVDMELRRGEPLTLDEIIDLPDAGDDGYPARISYALVGAADCDGRGGHACVALEMRMVIAGPAARAIYEQAMRADDSGDWTDTTVGDFQFNMTARIVTDPDTLVPYRVQSDWEQTVELVSYSDSDVLRQSGSTTITYDYD